MAERERNRSGLLAGVDSGQRLGAKDIDRETAAEERPKADALVSPDRIQPRRKDTRKVNPAHVTAMVESIAAVGLLEPLVVDLRYRLLAGAHRLAAILRLRECEPDSYVEWFPNGVPVRIINIDAEEQEREALEVEIAENEKRRDYNAKEVRDLARRLKELGYRDAPGRPAEGESTVMGRLTGILGKSERTVRRLLREKPASRRPHKPSTKDADTVAGETQPGEETRPNDRVSAATPADGEQTRSDDRVSTEAGARQETRPDDRVSAEAGARQETRPNDRVSAEAGARQETRPNDRVLPDVVRARQLVAELRDILLRLERPEAVRHLDACAAVIEAERDSL